jgi:serine/threonine protein kinase
MILEYADGGTLRDYLTEHFDGLTWMKKYTLGLSIVDGLERLHSLNIIHKDLVFISLVRLFHFNFEHSITVILRCLTCIF